MARLKITSFNSDTKAIHLRSNFHRYSTTLKEVTKLYKDGSIGITLENGKDIRCDTIVPVERLIKSSIKDYKTIRIKLDPKQVKLCDAKEISSKLHIAESTLRRWSDEEVRQHGYIRLGYFKNKLIYVEND